MPTYLVTHLGNYPLSQLAEEGGAPTLTVLQEADSAEEAASLAADRFEPYGPVGRVVVADAGGVVYGQEERADDSDGHDPENPPQNVPEPEPIVVVTDPGDLTVLTAPQA